MIETQTAKDAAAFAYESYPLDDQLETVVTSCARNCGSRHVLVAHKWKDVFMRLSTDDGRYQRGGYFGKDGNAEPQLRACLGGRSYRQRLYSAESLLYPMIRVGERGEGKFKRASWDEAPGMVAEKMVQIKNTYGSTSTTGSELRGCLFRCTAQVGSDRGADRALPRNVRLPHQFLAGSSYQGTRSSSRWTFGTIQNGNEDDTFTHSKLMIMWGWNPAYTFHGGNTSMHMRRMAKQ